MKKSTLLTLFIGFMFLGCSEKSVTQKSATQKSATQKSITRSEPKKEKSINESLAKDLLIEFQDDLESWNASVVYDGKEYTSLDDFLNKDK